MASRFGQAFFTTARNYYDLKSKLRGQNTQEMAAVSELMKEAAREKRQEKLDEANMRIMQLQEETGEMGLRFEKETYPYRVAGAKTAAELGREQLGLTREERERGGKRFGWEEKERPFIERELERKEKTEILNLDALKKNTDLLIAQTDALLPHVEEMMKMELGGKRVDYREKQAIEKFNTKMRPLLITAQETQNEMALKGFNLQSRQLLTNTILQIIQLYGQYSEGIPLNLLEGMRIAINDLAMNAGIPYQIPAGNIPAPAPTTGGYAPGVYQDDGKMSYEERKEMYKPAIIAAANRYGIDPYLLMAMIKNESNFKSRAVSSAGARGLGQLVPGTAKELGVTNSFDPEQNIDGAARYLKQMLDMFPDINQALAAYNWGPGNVKNMKRGSQFPKETQKYIQRIKGDWGSFQAVEIKPYQATPQEITIPESTQYLEDPVFGAMMANPKMNDAINKLDVERQKQMATDIATARKTAEAKAEKGCAKKNTTDEFFACVDLYSSKAFEREMDYIAEKYGIDLDPYDLEDIAARATTALMAGLRGIR